MTRVACRRHHAAPMFVSQSDLPPGVRTDPRIRMEADPCVQDNVERINRSCSVGAGECLRPKLVRHSRFSRWWFSWCCSSESDSCIFRPGSPIGLAPGQRRMLLRLPELATVRTWQAGWLRTTTPISSSTWRVTARLKSRCEWVTSAQLPEPSCVGEVCCGCRPRLIPTLHAWQGHASSGSIRSQRFVSRSCWRSVSG